MEEPFSSMESMLSSHLAFYSDGSPWRNLLAPWSQCVLSIWLSTQTGLHGGTFQLHGVSDFFSFGFLLRRVSMEEPFCSMESVLSFYLAFFSDGSPWRNLLAPWSQCFLFIWLSTQTGLHGGTFQLHGVSAFFSFGFLLRQVSMEGPFWLHGVSAFFSFGFSTQTGLHEGTF